CWQRTVGKELLAKNCWQRTVGKELLAKNWLGKELPPDRCRQRLRFTVQGAYPSAPLYPLCGQKRFGGWLGRGSVAPDQRISSFPCSTRRGWTCCCPGPGNQASGGNCRSRQGRQAARVGARDSQAPYRRRGHQPRRWEGTSVHDRPWTRS